MLLLDQPAQENFFKNGTYKISLVEDHDLPSLQTLLSGSESKDPYVRSATYFALTGRKGLWLAQSKSTSIIFCRHPNVDDEILLFPPIGQMNRSFVSMVINSIQSTGVSVRMARFAESNHKHVSTHSSYHVEEDILDWTYPVHTIDTHIVGEHRGRPFQQIRTALNNLKSDNLRVYDYEQPHHRSDILRVAKIWSDNDPEIIGFYKRLIDLSSKLPIQGRLVYEGHEPVAFSMWEETHPGEKFANTYAMLSSPEIVGLSRLLVVDMCQTLENKGFNLTCIGGSEDAGLDQYKRLLRPVHSVSLSSFLPLNEMQKIFYRGESQYSDVDRKFG